VTARRTWWRNDEPAADGLPIEPHPRRQPLMAPNTILEAASISKSFGSVRALVDVSLHVDRGEVVALAGENGSGKSTLARVLAGSIAADDGRFSLHGVACNFDGPHQALAAGIALVAQEPMVVPRMTVAENVLMHRLCRPGAIVRRRSLQRDAVAYLAEVGLDVDPARPLATLGHGERELVEVAKAISGDPHLLILDEATTRLPDPDRLFSVVERLAESRGMGTIIITHRLREIRRMAHRAFVLRDGRPVGELQRDEMTDERLSAMMVGRPLVDFFAKHDVPLGDVVLSVQSLVTDRCSEPVSFDVRRGEIVGIAGLVGSGRSEVLETLAGVRRPLAGATLLDGRRVAATSPRAAMTAGVCLVPEDRWAQGLVRNHSVVSNHSLSRYGLLSTRHRRVERRDARRDVARFRIKTPSIDAAVGQLSGGNAQKVVVARVVDQHPRVLLLDEPTRGVDIGAKAEIYGIVNEMVAAGVAVVIASSDLLELIGLCDRIIVMCEGRVAGELRRDEASEEAIALLSAGGTRSSHGQ
jgi:rhamnose transport system ATP-binding protein